MSDMSDGTEPATLNALTAIAYELRTANLLTFEAEQTRTAERHELTRSGIAMLVQARRQIQERLGL